MQLLQVLSSVAAQIIHIENACAFMKVFVHVCEYMIGLYAKLFEICMIRTFFIRVALQGGLSGYGGFSGFGAKPENPP